MIPVPAHGNRTVSYLRGQIKLIRLNGKPLPFVYYSGRPLRKKYPSTFLNAKKLKSILKKFTIKCGDQDKIVFCFYSLSISVSKFKTRCKIFLNFESAIKQPQKWFAAAICNTRYVLFIIMCIVLYIL